MRATQKLKLEKQFREAGSVSLQTALAADQRFAHIDASGHFDPVRHILLDNQVLRGRAGVHVFTPFYTPDGTAILVNRGWLPLAADRKNLPEIPTPHHETPLRGRLNILPVPGRMIGTPDMLQPDRWPQLVTYLDIQNISTALEIRMENRVVQLSDQEPHGFEGRDWKPVFLSAERHKGYAFQWFALTAAGILLWLFSSFRKLPGNDK